MKTILFVLLSSLALAQTKEVLTSFSIVESVTKELAPARVHVSSLVPQGQDWHSYKMSARDGAKIQKAQLVLYWGLGLDQALVDLVKRKDFKGQAVQITDKIPTLKGHTESHDLHHHDADPHLWQSPKLMVQVVENISKALTSTFPESKTEIESKTKSYVSKLQDLSAKYKKEFDQIPQEKKTILTSHQAFAYLGQEMGLQIESLHGLDSEMDPTIKEIQNLKQKVQSKKIATVFQEYNQPAALMEKVAGRAGPVLYSDCLGSGASTKSYLDFIEYNLKTILEELKK